MTTPPAERSILAAEANVGEVIEFVLASGASEALEEARRLRLELALEEAFLNICRHAFPERPEEVAVTVRVEPTRVTVELADGGPAFDPLARPDVAPEVGLEEREVGGLGTVFLQRMTDAVGYRRDRNRNVLTLEMLRRP